jgi:hypothetical protein
LEVATLIDPREAVEDLQVPFDPFLQVGGKEVKIQAFLS